jgi:5-methylthioadenosine/S-adenosylhomocysteine deaminase
MPNNQDQLTLIHCSTITMDAQDRYYPDGTIVIRDGRIEDIGPTGSIPLSGTILDMKERLVMPGLINTHTHSPSPLFRGMADDLKLMDWLKKLIWPAEKNLTGRLAYWGTSLSCLEFLESGVTTFADQYFFAQDVSEAAMNSGLRGFIAPTLFTEGSPETRDTVKAAIEMIEKYHGRESQTKIYPCIGPHAPYSCSAEILSKAAEIATTYDIPLHIHISETMDENRDIMEQTGLTPTQYLNSLGVLDCKVLAAHSIHLNTADIEIYRRKNVKVTYNPVSNLKLASGLMPLKALQENGVVVSMGTDGAQSNNSLDLLRDLKIGVLIQKQFHHDAAFLPAKEALKMVTINGAKALGMEDQIGSLEKGKQADIISFNLKASNLAPFHNSSAENAYSAIVYSATGQNVEDVFVGGELLMKNRVPLKTDRAQIIKEAQQSAEYIMKKIGLI